MAMPADLFVIREPRTVPSPICAYEGRCPKQGRAVYGAPVIYSGCVNRTIRCLTCQRTGEESLNTELETK